MSIDHVLALPMAGGEAQKIRARFFVVAAGVIESSRLLLMSRSQWFEEGLGNQHGEVGRYFTAHPSYQSRFRTTKSINVSGGQYRTCALNNDYRRRGLNATQFQLDVQRADDLDRQNIVEVLGFPVFFSCRSYFNDCTGFWAT